ncbi:MAG: AAA family ATPase [Desulfobacteraceae bacterium]|nr:AAA family ATPase [Desulfobacteraceae bacterium]
MHLKIGLCGSHRTGKTTLAKEISLKAGIPFVKTSTSEVFEQSGLHPADPMDFKTRIWIQHRVTDAAEKVWQAEQGSFVTDRTPVDMIAYTLGDIRGTTEADFNELKNYMDHCFEVTNKYFTKLAVIQPGIPLVYEKGKAKLNRAYIEHLNTVIMGLCSDERLATPSIIIKRSITAIEDRIRECLK